MKQSHQKSVLIVAGYAKSLLNFRLPLLRDLQARGYSVTAAAGSQKASITNKLENEGINFIPSPIERSAVNPFGDYTYYKFLVRLIKTVEPAFVFGYTHKAAIYSSLASPKGRSVVLITGLGYAFSESDRKVDLKRFVSRFILCRLYKKALARNMVTIFQNNEDRDEFVSRKLVVNAQTLRVMGTGVDLEFYSFDPPRNRNGKLRILCISRLIWEKGIGEYVEALKRLKKEDGDFEAKLVGRIDPNPSGISKRQLEDWIESGIISYHPEVEDVRNLLNWCDVFVLPSYYREGIPRTVQEAMAVGRPVVTTDSVGCRDTVRIPRDDFDSIAPGNFLVGENGCLVSIKDPLGLAKAILYMKNNPRARMDMGYAGRKNAEELFDVDRVNEQMLKRIGIF